MPERAEPRREQERGDLRRIAPHPARQGSRKAAAPGLAGLGERRSTAWQRGHPNGQIRARGFVGVDLSRCERELLDECLTIRSVSGSSMDCGEAPDFRFVHAADLHLGGRRWRRTPPAEGGFAELLRLADLLALRALVDLCLAERASLLICAGDVIDGWCRDHHVGLVLVRELSRLIDVPCEVVLLLGNHDVRTRVMTPLLLPGHARVVGVSGPETRVIERLGVAVHGWSLPSPASGTDVASLYPAPLAGLLNLGLLHTSAEGRLGHADYAPCSRRTLRAHGYDYWALGHVHAREVIATEPWIVFPGNLQGRGSRETGPKGATLVEVRRGRIASVEHRALDVVRFETIVADAHAAERFDDVLVAARAALSRAVLGAGRPVVARLVLAGAAGGACMLSASPSQRRGALGAVTRGLPAESLWIDEAWIDASGGVAHVGTA